MKKRILSRAIACALAASLCMTQASAVYYKDSKWADAETPFGLFAFSEAIEWTAKSPIFGDLTPQKVRPGYLVGYNGDKAIYSSFADLYKAFASPENDSLLSTLKHYESLEDEGTAVLTNQSHLAMMIGANPSDNITLEDQLVVSGRKAQLGIDDVNEKITLHLQGGIKVTDGGTLVIMNDRTAQAMGDMNLEIVLGESILVEDGGYLILQSVDALKNTTEDVGGIPTQRNTIVAPESKPAIVVDGGTVNVSHQTLKRSDDDASNEALIQVKSGEVSFEPSSGQSAQTGLPQFSGNSALASDKFNFELDNGDSTAPAISVEKDASVTIKTGDFSSENGTIFDLADGATLNLEGGTISNTGDKPAIHADSGATVILPEDPNAIQITTSNENGQAIDLAGGSKVQKGDTTITVGADGDSYVDNDGSIILGAGSSVTDPNGTTELPNGGSVDQDGDVTQNALPAESISLNQTSVTLYSNTTPNTVQLIADVTPDNTTDSVAWSSDNEAVATVNESGLVTAVSNGSATITATAGNVSAACTVTVTTYTSGGGSSDDDSDPTYSVTLPKNVKGGEVKTSHRYAEQGNTVTITVDPDKGYELDELTVTDSKGKELDLTDKGNGKYTFKMPGTRVEVEVSFKLVETEPEAPAFADVPASAYYADAVKWAVEQGITSGTSATTFSPDMSCTRAQIVTFLWRANGAPKADGANPFTDVSADAYYYDAVLWAVKEGITSGTSATTFSPDATVTRAQTVTFLYRAAGAPAVTGGSFADVAADAYYAGAVAWAVKEGVTSGTGGNNFSPDAPCTRGQIVTFMYRGVQ